MSWRDKVEVVDSPSWRSRVEAVDAPERKGAWDNIKSFASDAIGAAGEAVDGVLKGDNAIGGAYRALTREEASPSPLERPNARPATTRSTILPNDPTIDFNQSISGRSLSLPKSVARAANERGQDAGVKASEQVAAQEDSWSEIGRKFFDRIGPLVKQSVGGIGQALTETSGYVPIGTPLSTAETEEFQGRIDEALRIARERKLIPGQKLAEIASQDLRENGYNFGDNALKKYPAMIAESVVQMLPSIAASVATRNPSIAGLVTAGQVGGSQYAESREAGRDRGAALGDSVVIGAAEAIGERIPVGILMKPGGKFLPKVLKAMGAESLQETFTQSVQSLYDKGVLHPEMTWGEVRNQVVDAAIVGAGMGGSFAVGFGAFDATGRIAGRRADDTRTPGSGIREDAVAGAINLTPEDMASPLDNADLAAGKAEIAAATSGAQVDAALSQAGLPKAGTKVSVSNLPGGANLNGTIEDVFSDETGTGVVIRPEDGGSVMREYLDTLNELGVSITPFFPMAEADAIDAALVAQSSAPMEVSSPLPSAGAETPSPRPSGRTPSASAGGGVNRTIVEGLKKRGFSEGQALGIAAGIHAESASNPGAKNPTSGAMGLGQWLGPRKDALRKRFGDNPTLEQQLDFLADELRGGDAGGKHVLAQSDPAKVLDAYIRKFMRPAAGAETDGDLARGMAALGLGVTDGTASDAPFVPEGSTQDDGTPEAPEEPARRATQPQVLLPDDLTTPTPAPVPGVNPATFRIEDTKSGKAFALIGASGEQVASVNQAVPAAKPVRRKDGALVYAKKYEADVRAALSSPIGEEPAPVRIESGAYTSIRENFAQVEQEAQQPSVANAPAPDLPQQDDAVVETMPNAGSRNKLVVRTFATEEGYTAEADYELGGFAGGGLSAQGKDASEARANLAARMARQLDPSTFGSSANDQHRKSASKMLEWIGANTNGPQDGGVAPTVKAPKAGGPDATAASNAGSAAGVATPSKSLEEEDNRLTAAERKALESALRSSATGGSGWAKDSSAGLRAQEILDTGHTRDESDAKLLETAVRLESQRKKRMGARPSDDQANVAPTTDQAVGSESASIVETSNLTAPSPNEAGSEKNPSRIEDFGEQLAGARKDFWQSYKDRLADAAEIDVTAEPLSKTWPEPDYQKLLDAGADPYVVAWVHAARDEIPTKPQKGWKLKGWAENVRLLRDTATKLLNDEIGADALVKRMSGELSRSLRDLQGRVDLYRDMGHSKSLKGITFSQNYYSLYRGERDVTKWVVEKRAKATAFGNWPREIAVGDTREEALAKFKAIYDAGNLDGKQDKIVRFDIYSRRGEPGFMIGKKIGKDYVDLKRFGTAKEARDFKISDAGYAELVAALEQYKDIPPERKASNAPRIGIDHRSGADVTPEAFAEAFGFRGVQFGNYVEGERRQSDLNEAYDALMDLAGVIGIPARALSLNGELGLAFGARGKGGKGAAAAHFEPDTIVINLTKNKGAGSLAHEWWHSLDNYFSRMRAPGGYMTEGKITATDGVRPEMVQAFKDVMTALRSTSLKERSKNLDKRRTKEYWATDIEMSARAFESYVIAKLQDEQFSNDYLANVVSEKAFGIEDGYPYLRAAEIPPVRAAFDEFFNTVETRETERGLALRSLPEGEAVGQATDVKATLREQMANLRLADKVKVRLVDTLGGAAGEYRAQIVTIAQDTPQGEVFTLNHEAIHVLRDLGLFNTSEWAILSAKAKRETGLMRSIRQRYEAGFRERGMSGPALQEALIEEAVADMFARHQDGRYKAEGTTDRLFKMLRQFFEAVRNAFAGRGLRTAEGVMQDVAAGEVGGREVLPDIFERPLQSLPEGDADSDPTFDNSDIEARFQAAKDGVGSQITLRDRIADSMERAWHGITRHWINLPNVPEYAALQEKLRAIEAAPQAAKERTLRMLDDMVRDFSNEDLDLFTRKVILDDLFWDASNDRDLPFGFTRETLTAERAKIDQILEAQPGQKILTAVAKRKRANRIIAKELVDAGVLEAEQIKNPAYYRHQVLEYARAQMKIARGTGKRLRSPKWAKRMGSSLDINANLLEAEFDWLNKAFVDIPVARAIEWIKNSEHNILDRLRSEARESNRKGIEERVAEAQEIVDNPREYDAEDVAKATALISISRSFGRNIAMGFGKVRAALESGEVEYPARFEAVAKGIIEGTSDNQQPPFEFLTWMLDNNAPGAIGAAMIMKAVGQRRSWTKDVLGKAYVEPDSANDLIDRLAPEGYTTWQPDEGKLLFTVKTIPERVIDEMLMQMDTPKGVDPDVVRAALEGARTSMALGGAKYTMVLPEEVAATLNQLRREEVDSIGKTLVREPVRMWKQWVLINPRRFLKYNFNNLSGDLDAIIAGKPKALRRVGEAGRELYRVMKKGEKPSARYEEAVARGVFDSGLSVQEIPDIHMLEPFERFAKKPNLASKMTLLVLRKAWNGLQGFTQWREGVFRYALYLDFVDRLEAGESQASVGYGASRPDMVDAVPDLKDRAAMLARDLIGDYGAISHYGANLRETILPFWSWMEINTKRYWRLTANAYGQGVGQGLATSGGLAAWKSVQLLLRMGVLFAIISMWNNLFFDDEEDDLSEDQRRQMHMIFGRYEDGSVRTMRLQGSFSDALSWFGWQDVLAAVEEYEKGRESLVGVLLKGAKAPINKVGTSISPTITVPLESAFGRKLWPDVFNTRPLDDGWRNLFSTFSLENEYDLVMDRPSRGYARSWQESVLYRRDPGEMAYGEVRGKVYDWLEREKGQTGGGGVSTPKSQAMKDYRQALKFGDLEAARNAWDRMVELGVTENGYRAMMRRAAPLGPIAKKDRQAFVDQMTEEEYQAYLRADAWYRETFRPNEIGVRSDDEVDANGE